MKKIITLTIVFAVVLSANCQNKKSVTEQQQIKEFFEKVKKMDIPHQRAALNDMVYRINSLDNYSRGVWIAAMEANFPKQKPKVVPVNEWTQDEVESKLIEKIKQEMVDNETNWRWHYEPESEELKSIEIIERVSDKQIAESYNGRIQKEIDSINVILDKKKIERKRLKALIPENYQLTYDPADTIRHHYQDFKEVTDYIVMQTRYIQEREPFLIKEKSNWFDPERATKTRFLIKTVILPKNGLDDAEPEIHYMIGKFHPLDDKTNAKSQLIFIDEPKRNFENKKERIPTQDLYYYSEN